ncbi:MAG: DUF3568 family protein [Syntrophobacterales bacterium]|nr:MAG: DUF3568 family protein [Syntrophobacterales bacterium]
MFRRLNKAILLLVLAIQISGCAEAVFVGVGAVGGAGAALFYKGKMEENLDISFSKAHAATLAALKDLELPINKDQKKGLKASIESQFPEGKQVWISVRAVTESSSKITVRVGMSGDKARSQKIFDAIHQHL